MSRSTGRIAARIRRKLAEAGAGPTRIQRLWRVLKRPAPVGPLAVILPIVLVVRFHFVVGGGELLLVFLAGCVGLGAWSDLLQHRLCRSDDVARFAYMPVSDTKLLRHIWLSCLRSSTVELYFLAVAYGSLAWAHCFDTWKWLATAAIVTLHWLTGLALITAAAAYWPQWCTSRFSDQLNGAAFSLLITVFVLAELLAPYLVPFCNWILLVLPTGWAGYVFRNTLLGGLWPAWPMILPALALAALLPLAYRRLKRRYQVQQFLVGADGRLMAILEGPQTEWPTVSFIFGKMSASVAEATSSRSRMAEGAHQHEARLSDRHFPSDLAAIRYRLRKGVDWQRAGILEGLVGKWLTPRERAIADVLLGNVGLIGPRWSERWRRRSLRLLAAAALILVIGPSAYPSDIVLCWILAVCALAPVLGKDWLGLMGAAREPLTRLSNLPVTCQEICWVSFKSAIVPILAWSPQALLVGLLIAWELRVPGSTGIVVAAKLLFGAIAIQPLPWIIMLDGTTNQRLPLRAMLTVFPALLLEFALLAVGGLMLFRAPPIWAVLGGTMLAAGSWGLWQTYGHWYERGSVDLIPRKRQS